MLVVIGRHSIFLHAMTVENTLGQESWSAQPPHNGSVWTLLIFIFLIQTFNYGYICVKLRNKGKHKLSLYITRVRSYLLKVLVCVPDQHMVSHIDGKVAKFE